MIARIGGAALAISVLLPWFALEVAQLSLSEGFSLRKFEQNAAIILVVVGVLCMVQPRLGSADATATAYLAIGGLMAAAIIYKVFVSPPGSEYMDLASADGVSVKQVLSSMGIEFKPSHGAYVGIAGAAAIAFGGFVQLRAGGSPKDLGLSVEEQAAFAGLRPHTPIQPVELSPGQQRYVAPAPPQFAMQPPPQQYGASVQPPQQ